MATEPDEFDDELVSEELESDELESDAELPEGTEITPDDMELASQMALAVVCSKTAKLADPATIIKLLNEELKLLDIEDDEVLCEDGNIVLAINDAQLIISSMPAPYPWEDLEAPCATAWWWPEATEIMQPHQHHFLVVIMGDENLDPVERRVWLTRLVRVLLQASDAVGVFWCDGTVVHSPEEFLEQSIDISPTDIPATLWLDVRVQENDDQTHCCFTTGMAALGHLEIEVASSQIEPMDLMDFVTAVAAHVVNNQEELVAGETIGRTEEERYEISFAPSMFDPQEVMLLTLSE